MCAHQGLGAVDFGYPAFCQWEIFALLSYLLYLDWRLTLVTLTVGPIIAILIQSFGKRIRKASKASLESLRAIAHTVEETTAANRVIKVYGGQEQRHEYADVFIACAKDSAARVNNQAIDCCQKGNSWNAPTLSS